jgi:hypothetical protein
MICQHVRAKTEMHFKTMIQTDVPQGRNGKHKLIVTTLLKDLAQWNDGAAIKVPGRTGRIERKVRSALNRATRKLGSKLRPRPMPLYTSGT